MIKVTCAFHPVFLATFIAGLSVGLWGPTINDTWANPHTTVLKKNNPVKYDSRDEIEGSRGIINHIRIPHGCNDKTVKAMGVVFPNGQDSVATDKSNGQEVNLIDHITGSAIAVHPIQDYDVFEKIRVKEGTINNVGNGQSTGIRAIHYKDGKLKPDNVGIIPFDTAFPSFNANSCVGSLQVNIAIGNYCTPSKKKDNRADIWIGHMTPLYDDPAVVVQSPLGFWPQLTVIRDTENNPLPGNCPLGGIHLEVTPASHEIDEYLPIRGFWPNN